MLMVPVNKPVRGFPQCLFLNMSCACSSASATDLVETVASLGETAGDQTIQTSDADAVRQGQDPQDQEGNRNQQAVKAACWSWEAARLKPRVLMSENSSSQPKRCP